MEEFDKLDHNEVLSVARGIATYDTRIDRCKKHDAVTIVFITLCAVLCRQETWNEIADFADMYKERLEKWLGPLKSLPSHDTISRFFSLLKPEAFEAEYRQWINMVFKRHDKTGEKPDVIAVDGKEIRGASKQGDRMIMLSAYSTGLGISLGQEIVERKSNEIPAMQKLIPMLDIKNCVITADALHCQKKNCQTIIDGNGDFFFTTKGNQKGLMNSIIEGVGYARRLKPCKDIDKAMSVDRSHSKETHRTCIAVGQPLYLGSQYKDWPGIKSFGAIIKEENDKTETRYFISSLKLDAKYFLEVARRHWGIENGLHRRLDVDFREDESRKRKNAAKNFSLIRKMAIAILSLDKSKISFNRKRFRMLAKEEYFHSMLTKLQEIL